MNSQVAEMRGVLVAEVASVDKPPSEGKVSRRDFLRFWRRSVSVVPVEPSQPLRTERLSGW